MKTIELISWLEEKYPVKAAENWDNVGLLVGDDSGKVKHVFLALDLTEKVLEEALEAGADMIITHHPMIFSGMKKINNHTFTGRKILKLIQNGITYYATKELSFGQAGTTGTDFTFVLDWDNNKTAFTVGKNETLGITARLYNTTNKE